MTASLDYLEQLGVTDVYLSPIALAREGSTHGYDVCDPNVLDEAVGDPSDLDALAEALRFRGMGLILDIVPNHLATDEMRNPWWRDVLAKGPASKFAAHFDIDWNPGPPARAGKVLLPILDHPYGDVLESGGLCVGERNGVHVLTYGDRHFPISSADPAELDAIARTPTAGRIHALLERQHYRLAHWRTASDEINYRRFFNIEHLVGVRVEDPGVFDASHRWLSELLGRGVVTGVRVDHPDGLAAPGEYLARLQGLGREAPASPLFVVVEKVLVGDETLPSDWPVQGTTGYEYLNALNQVFVARQELGRLQRGYARFVGHQISFERTEYDAKKQVIATTFVSECDRLVARLRRLAERDRRHRDLGAQVLRRALVELTACLPVYRTYVDRRGCRAADLVVISQSLQRIIKRRPHGMDERALRFTVAVVTSPRVGREHLEFVTRWQQFSSAVFAKAVEDRAFYRDNTLLSLNEVGSDRARPGADIAAFHAANSARVIHSHHGLLATTTHDTKLSEDVRARLHVLTECSGEWLARADEWRRLNNRHRKQTHQGRAPDRDDEYRFYQLLIGLWPPDAKVPPESISHRLTAAMIKGAREAARRTTWTMPDEEYESALGAFVKASLAGEAFVRSVSEFGCAVARAGLVNSLAQTVLKIGSPGVPDFYQGTELCSLRLADPDNRQPIDTSYRRRMLDDIRQALREEDSRPATVRRLLGRWQDGGIKMFVTAEALAERRAFPELFTAGGYIPLAVRQPRGPRSPELIAFARTHEGRTAIVAAPRFAGRTSMGGSWPVGAEVWGDAAVQLPSSIEAQTYTDRFTGVTLAAENDSLPVKDLLAVCPVSLCLST